jgi:hypothetical protein
MFLGHVDPIFFLTLVHICMHQFDYLYLLQLYDGILWLVYLLSPAVIGVIQVFHIL